MPDALLTPTSVADVQAVAREHERVLSRGNGTKTALSAAPAGSISLNLTKLSGIIEYAPGEFTFTALAGTRVTEISAALAEHGQYLPFDPLLAEAGATLGGTVAAAANGPGRYRYGGLRDFILGVRYVDGDGQLVYAGGKVVKNAAGFDLPKLMVGSLGQFGVLIEMTFKVFPKPEAYATLRLDCPSLADGVSTVVRLTGQPLDLDALDLATAAGAAAGAALWVRLAGLADALPARIERVRGLLGGGDPVVGNLEAALWRDVRELAWVPTDWTLVKAPLTPKKLAGLEKGLAGLTTQRRYSVAGQVAWIATPEPARLDAILSANGLSGLALLGPPGQTRFGVRAGEPFERRVKQALDPQARFIVR
jgi:glycolate oxidase FAD binding subunit